MNEITENVEYALSADYRGGLWDRVVKAADAHNRATDKLNVVAQRWISGEILAGTARQDVLHAVRANPATATALKDSTLLSGWTSAVSRAARAFDALTAERPDLADVHVRLAVTGADAYTWRGVFRKDKDGNPKPASGKRAAGDTFAPMAITAAMDNAVRVGMDGLNTLVRRDAEFVGALSAAGVPVLRFLQIWHETGNAKGGDVPPAESDAAESDAAESDAAESDAAESDAAVSDAWLFVALAVEALARVEAHAGDLSSAQRGTAWKTLGASMTAVRSAYVAANDSASVKA